jgi:NAD(P)-dependent dehydrogenase (short-subunit alcohol dehydrogenase family)
MKNFAGRIAVVTGGGSGMGRELVRQLAAEACNVAMCDVSASGMAETLRLCEMAGLPQGLRVSTHIADVSDAAQVERFRDEVADRHQTDKIHLLFNNAGIGGGGSMIAHSRDEWEKTFNICWGGVYNCTRALLPMLLKAEEGHIVNTSSVNGFWASVGPRIPHTAYSAAKFAVKGFTEALIADLKINAPHVKCSVVMPGHIGTSITANSRKIQSGGEAEDFGPTQIAQARARIASMPRSIATLGRGHPQTGGRARPPLSRRGADECGASGGDHPRRRQGRALAHPRRPRRAHHRRNGAQIAGTGLRHRLFRRLRRQRGLAHRRVNRVGRAAASTAGNQDERDDYLLGLILLRRSAPRNDNNLLGHCEPIYGVIASKAKQSRGIARSDCSIRTASGACLAPEDI